MNESHRLIPLIPGLIQILDSDDETVQSIGNAQMAMLSQSSGGLIAGYLDQLITLFLEDGKADVLSKCKLVLMMMMVMVMMMIMIMIMM